MFSKMLSMEKNIQTGIFFTMPIQENNKKYMDFIKLKIIKSKFPLIILITILPSN